MLHRAVLFVRVLVGATFVTSGLLKLIHPDAFATALSTYGLLSAEEGELVQSVLPPVEITLGTLFAVKYRAILLGRIIVALLIFFTLTTGVALLQGSVVNCGCFPRADEPDPVGPGFFLSNLLLVLATVWTSGALHPGDRRASSTTCSPAWRGWWRSGWREARRR
jgi:hypothetical protein